MRILPYLLVLPFLAICMQGCLKDSCSRKITYTYFEPVYKHPSEWRSGSLTIEPAKSLKHPGKMCAFGKYLFINEPQEGLHVIDNANPASPRTIAFWRIPGNVDVLAYDHYLYVDQYADLLTLDIADPANPREVSRTNNLFTLNGFDPEKGMLVDFRQTDRIETYSCDEGYYGVAWAWCGDGGIFMDLANPQANQAPVAISGVNGSYSRFAQANGYLYGLDLYSLKVLDRSNPAAPERRDSIFLGWNLETLFAWNDYLFAGSQFAVYLLDNHNPAKPAVLQTFQHARGCDPVVCDERHAYVTVHDGTDCGSSPNQLYLIDIQSPEQARLLKEYNMTRPFGLSVNGNFLYLCDDGLKIFNKSDPLALELQSHLPSVKATDVIVLDPSHLLLIGEEGLLQFDVSDPRHPVQISKLEVNP